MLAVPLARLLHVLAVNDWPRNRFSAAFAGASNGATMAGSCSRQKPGVFGGNRKCGLLQKLMPKCKMQEAWARSPFLSGVSSVNRLLLKEIYLKSSKSKDIRVEVFLYH